MNEDHPRATADYMIRNKMTKKKKRDPYLKWANHTIPDIRKIIQQTIKLYDFSMDESD